MDKCANHHIDSIQCDVRTETCQGDGISGPGANGAGSLLQAMAAKCPTTGAPIV